MTALFQYQWPIIRELRDVLPHVADSKEFVVITSDHHVIVDYVVQSNDTFRGVQSEDDIEAKIRRECRGIAFDKFTNEIVSRPFQKFFNVGEREFTMPDQLPSFEGAQVHRKYDGSMIRVLWYRRSGQAEIGYRLGTRKGVTDTSMQAEKYLISMPRERLEQYEQLFNYCYNAGITPIFEFISPDNQIVIRYDEADLVLLALRETVTGRYVPFDSVGNACKYGAGGVTIARRAGDNDIVTLDAMLKKTYADTEHEGVILSFTDGGRVKVKSAWYVQMHKAKSSIMRKHDLFSAVFDGNIDDIKPLLDADLRERVEDFEEHVTAGFRKAAQSLVNYVADIRLKQLSRKEFALTFNGNPAYKHLVFQLFDADINDVMPVLETFIKDNMRSSRMFPRVAALLELEDETIWPNIQGRVKKEPA